MTAVTLTNLEAFDVEELDARTMEDVQGGAWGVLVSLAVGLAVSFFTNLPDVIDGARDGANMCT